MELIILSVIPTYFISNKYFYCQCEYFDTHLYVIIQLCCSLYSTYIQAILYIIVQFNAPFANIHLTSSLYCNSLQILWFGTCDAGTLTDKQYSVIIVSVFNCVMSVVTVLYIVLHILQYASLCVF